MKIIINESQLKRFVFENINDEGWFRDADTNKIYWDKNSDKYITRKKPYWKKLDYVPKTWGWGGKHPIETFNSPNKVENPQLGQKIFSKKDNSYFEYTDKVDGDIDVPGADTRILTKDKKWNVKVINLPKTGIKSYHFIGLPSFDLTKSMKHGYIERGHARGKIPFDVSFDRKSIYDFAEYMRTYVWHFLKSYNGTGFLPIDVIIAPESTGKLNNILIKEISKLIPNAKIMKGAFQKNAEGMKLNQDILRTKGDEYMRQTYMKDIYTMTPEQEKLYMTTLEKAIAQINNDFEKDRVRGLAKEMLKQIKIAKEQLKSLGKGNHKTARELFNKKVQEVEEKIDMLIEPYFKSRNYSPFYKNDKLMDYDSVKGIQIKRLHQIARLALEDFFKLTTANDKQITYTDKDNNIVNKTITTAQQLKNKRILIVDDNFSTGATLDNICELLLKMGISRNDIIPITLGVVKRAYAASGIDPFNPQI